MTFRFESEDINKVRRWLRLAGLDCDITGWHGNGRLGCITYHRGRFCGAHWKSELAR